MPSCLVVEDDKGSLDALCEWVERAGFTSHRAASLGRAIELAEENDFDLALVDLQLPDGGGLDLLPHLEKSGAEVVVVTGHASVDNAVAALRGGVGDYLTKPVDSQRLRRILEHVRRALEMRDEIGTLRSELRGLGRFGEIVGASQAMQRVYDLIERVAPSDATVFVTGETGTGKELVAQTIHSLSPRAKKPFVAVNCGAVPESLIESELFGHERGSFTGADRRRRGVFEQASGGTLFLDEITEMPLELQVTLLRVLETGSVTRLGGDRSLEVDVRVVAATNRDPEEAVAEGKLREDLLYRLLVFPIELPPLRQREGDAELLAQTFLERLNRDRGCSKVFTAQALERLRRHSWPGNVRELMNAVERGFIVASERIDADCVPAGENGLEDPPHGSVPHDGCVEAGVGTSIAEMERRLIVATLSAFGGNKREAAKTLGISLKTLYNRLHSYDDTERFIRVANAPSPREGPRRSPATPA